MKKVIAIVGPSEATCTPDIYEFGLELGASLTEAGYVIVCGGRKGLMEAVCKGAKTSPVTFFGATIGILPGEDKSRGNAWCDVLLPTGVGFARNSLVVRAGDAVVPVGGGAGTLSEIAYAWQYEKPLICVSGLGGWSEKLAGTSLDVRSDEPIVTAHSVEDVLAELATKFEKA